MTQKCFNIRVYGLLINDKNQVLVADELIKGMKITKFPGGGLEFGEGTIDCLKREFVEETGQIITVSRHFYTTDFFQQSAFNSAHQIVSIYYMVEPEGGLEISTREKKFDFDESDPEPCSFRWLDLENLRREDFNLPIDKKVAEMLINEFKA